MNGLLEAAAVAGRLGFCDSGLPLALRAAHLSVVADAESKLDRVTPGEAFECLNADPFREFAAI
jgi:hypothetical protein